MGAAPEGAAPLASGAVLELPQMTAAARGGQQRIPRPDGVFPGNLATWADLDPHEWHFTLDDVRAVAGEVPRRVRGGAPADTRAAAVLVPFVAEEGAEAHVILTKRPETMPSHQGDIAFPGGKVDAVLDADLVGTALREAHEEIGLPPAAVEIVGELDSLLIARSGFWLTPFVGVVKGRPVLVPDAREVAGIFEVPVSALLAPGVYRQERWEFTDPTPGYDPDSGPQQLRTVEFFELPDETVWGATARILARFLERLTAIR